MGDELSFSTETLTDTWAIGCATLAIGSVMLIPFALKYGLRPIYVLSTAGTLGVMVWAANTQTAGDWWGVNVLQCWLGSLAEVMVQMTGESLYELGSDMLRGFGLDASIENLHLLLVDQGNQFEPKLCLRCMFEYTAAA